MLPPVVTMHLVGLAVYLATCVYLLLVLLPSAALAKDAGIQRRRLAAALRVLNPAAIGALGLVLVSGAFRLTDIKAGLGPAFFAAIGRPLAVKLTLAFLVINLATYVAFGCGLRLVRAQQGNLPLDAAWQRRMLVRMGIATCIALGLTLAAVYVSLAIGGVLHRANPPAPGAAASLPHKSASVPHVSQARDPGRVHGGGAPGHPSGGHQRPRFARAGEMRRALPARHAGGTLMARACPSARRRRGHG
jgi:uncharacterized membrane protein